MARSPVAAGTSRRFRQALANRCLFLVAPSIPTCCLIAFVLAGAAGAQDALTPADGSVATEENVESNSDYLTEGAVAFASGRLELAAMLYQKACEAAPDDPELRYRLAVVHETMDDLPKAIASYARLLKMPAAGRWGEYAAARLPALRAKAAFGRIERAEQLAAEHKYDEAMKWLRNASSFSPSPAVNREIRRRYYQFAAQDIARRLDIDMTKAALRSVAIADFAPGDARGSLDAGYFSAMLWRVMREHTAIAVAPADLAPGLAERLVALPPGRKAEGRLSESGSAPQADCILAGVWAKGPAVVLIDTQSRLVMMSLNHPALGSVPPTPVADAWYRLPASSGTNYELRAWVWGEQEYLPEDTGGMKLTVEADQPCYIVLVQLDPDGTLRLLQPSSLDPESFLAEGHSYSFDCFAGRRGQVTGVWMIASRTPLISWPEIALVEGDRGEAVIKRISAQLPSLPKPSWVTSAWTWSRLGGGTGQALEPARPGPQDQGPNPPDRVHWP